MNLDHLDETKDHHPFCNRGKHWGPRKDCRWCDDYYRNYPLRKGEDSLDLIKRNFPNVEIIK